MEWLQSADIYLFREINQVWVNPIFDQLMPVLRQKNTWIGLYVLLGLFLLRKHGKNSILLMIWIMIGIGISDVLCGQLLKDIFMRLRPCADSDMKGLVRLLIKCSQGYSFPSAHASNHMLIALLFSYVSVRSGNKIWPFVLITWALSIGYAQVYVGVHYPGDVLGGFLISFLIFLLMIFLFNKISFFRKIKWKENQIFEKN